MGHASTMYWFREEFLTTRWGIGIDKSIKERWEVGGWVDQEVERRRMFPYIAPPPPTPQIQLMLLHFPKCVSIQALNGT